MRVFRSLLFVLCGILLTSAVSAGPSGSKQEETAARERSRAAFRRGVTLAKGGDYAAARDAFQEAYRLFSHPSILLNLGLARAKTGEYVDAEQDLLRFLVDDGGAMPEEKKSARAVLAEVRMHLGTLHVRVDPDGARATLDGKPLALVPGSAAEVRVVAGEHVLHAESEGYEPADERLRVLPGRDLSRRIALAPEEAPENAAARKVEEDTTGKRKGASPLAKADRGASPLAKEVPATSTNEAATSNVMGWSLVGIGAATVGFATFCGFRALSLSDEYERTGATDTKSTGITFRTLADVSFLVGLASAGIGAYLLLVPAFPAKHARLVVSPGHTAIVGSF